MAKPRKTTSELQQALTTAITNKEFAAARKLASEIDARMHTEIYVVWVNHLATNSKAS